MQATYRDGVYVSSVQSFCQQSGYHMMEEIYRGAYINKFLRDTKFPSCNVEQLSQRGGLDKTIHLQDSPDHTLSVDISEHILSWQKEWLYPKQMMDKLLQHINSLSDVSPEELPDSSRFLLKINFLELFKYHLETQRYWTLAVDMALKANALEHAQAAQAKRVRRKLNTKVPSRQKLGIAAVEHQIR